MGMKASKIVLSGMRCTGKTTLFWNMQKELAIPTFSVSQYLRDYIRTNGLQGKGNEEIDRHNEIMSREIDERVVALLKSKHEVLVESRVFRYVRESFDDTLKILLVASDDCKVKRSSYRENIDFKKAKKRLIKRENEWMEKMADQYGFGDFFDPKYYDLVVDTTDMNPMQVMKRVMGEL